MKNKHIRIGTLLAIFAVVGYGANAQTTSLKLGTNSTVKDPSALIELEANNKGALLPRVALTSLTDATTIANAAHALTVFNTATTSTGTNDVTPGYYYWRKDLITPANSRWVRLLDDTTPGIEPWQVQGTANKATLNTQNIYQMGSIAIGKNTVQTGVALDILGAVRGGANHSGTVGINSVAFGDDNKASGEATVVAGGGLNNVTQPYSSIGGGFMNNATGQFNTIAGGQSNEASASMATIAGGYNNKATNNATVISGGQNNKAAGIYSVIAGGTDNETGAANASYSVIAGGNKNTAQGDASTISGGVYNNAKGSNSTISGGLQNKAVGANSVVAGGTANTAQSFGEWVGGINSTNYVPGSAATFMAKDRLFNIGNGDGSGGAASVSDAFTILKDATTGIGFPNFQTTTFNEKLQVNGNARFATLPSIIGNVATDKFVVADANGVLKTVAPVTTAAPRFFYAPSMVMPTTNTDLPANVTYNAGTQTFTVDMYAIYNYQFSMTGESAATKSAIRSAGAGNLEVLAANALGYFVTYFDNTVYDPASITLSADGKLSYKILAGANVTAKTYMNIVFKQL